MGDDLGNFCLGDAMLPADAQMGGQLFDIATGNQCGNGDQTARAGRQLLFTGPDLSEQDIIVHEAFLHGDWGAGPADVSVCPLRFRVATGLHRLSVDVRRIYGAR